MGLNSALVDRARAVHEHAAPVRIEGTTEYLESTGPWFKVRFSMPSSPRTESGARVQARQSSGERTRTIERPSLLIGLRDLEGNSLLGEDGRCTLSSQDRIEINSPQLGRYLYEIASDPVAIRKKRKVIGFTASVSRVAEHETKKLVP